jgi:transcriptional regulator with XRE-family HTH domain
VYFFFTMSEIGKRFKELIVANNDSNKSFATKIGVNANYISMMITGRKPISDSILYSIKKEIPNLNEEWLLHDKGTMFIGVQDVIPNTLDAKFLEISDDEFALYFTKHKDRLLQNDIIKVVIDKEVSELYINKLKDDIKKLSDNS